MALLVIAMVIVFGLGLNAQRERHNQQIRDWTAQNGYQIVGDINKKYLNHGPFWWRTDSDDDVYEVMIEDGNHQRHELWIWAGAFSNSYKVE